MIGPPEAWDLVQKLDALAVLQDKLKREMAAVQQASLPSDRAYWRAHKACLRAVWGDQGEPHLPLPPIPDPFPFELYATRDDASRASYPYRREITQLRAHIKQVERETKACRNELKARARRKRQGTLDF